MEEAYAKKIALVIDAAKPGMSIEIDMRSAIAKSKGYTGKIVDIKGNLVTVKLSQKGGYSYSFFNDVSSSLNKTYFSFPSDGDSYSFKILKLEELPK
ncbi:MAG: hypothetical protein ABIH28_02875 [archaeon]